MEGGFQDTSRVSEWVALKTTRTVGCCSMRSKAIKSGVSTFSIEQNGCWSLATASSATEHELFIAPSVVPSPLCDWLFSLGLLYAMWKTKWHLCWCSLSNSTHDKSNVAINVAAQLLNSVHGQTVWGPLQGMIKRWYIWPNTRGEYILEIMAPGIVRVAKLQAAELFYSFDFQFGHSGRIEVDHKTCSNIIQCNS